MRLATVKVLIKEYEDADGYIRMAVYPTDGDGNQTISIPAHDLVKLDGDDED